ncbi:hypothetical protein LTR17_021854 [Elasticomyces elasticus]|nr:hypothetical protein LTR17_021854 [Elasticomyces elasticus]
MGTLLSAMVEPSEPPKTTWESRQSPRSKIRRCRMEGRPAPEAQWDSNWPGEREPSHRDVEAASEVPESAWLSDFKVCLMASEDAQDVEDLMHLDLRASPPSGYTYPLMLLSSFPSQLPTESEITKLREVFVDCSRGHVFLNQLQVHASRQEQLAAPLSFAIACLASVHCRHAEAEARDLFLASRGLGGALMEIDNAESRSPDLLVAATLNSLYGAVSSDPDIWDKSGQTLCTATTTAIMNDGDTDCSTHAISQHKAFRKSSGQILASLEVISTR